MKTTRPLPVVHDLEVDGAILRYRSDLGEVAPAIGPRPDFFQVEQPLDRFRPTCLTVAVAGECDQACVYCKARSAGRQEWASEGAIQAATRLVARQAMRDGVPFVAGLHGVSEPLADPIRARRIVECIGEEAERLGTSVRFGVTTSGVVDERCIRWVGGLFESITLSMDGPAEVHDQQRPDFAGAGTWARVDATLSKLAGNSRPPHLAVRMTLTRLGLDRLPDDVEWMIRRYHPDAIVVQPVYGEKSLRPQGEIFAKQLANARRRATELGVKVILPGNRPGERHGPFCAPLQGNLLLTPDDRAAWCFADLGLDGPSIGSYDSRNRRFEIDHGLFRDLAHAAWNPPTMCIDCANVNHCARGCPDSCVLTSQPDVEWCETFQYDLRHRLSEMVGREGHLP